MAKEIITQHRVRELFDYLDGHLFWKENRGNNKVKGLKAGTLNNFGYITIAINHDTYKAHRLIYLHHYGEFKGDLDHINGNRSDNRIENLRIATNSENQWNRKKQKNNKSGCKNVSFCKKTKKWRVQFYLNKKPSTYGYYKDIDYAIFVANALRPKFYGKFATNLM